MKVGCIGTDVLGVKVRGNNEALLHWERNRWLATYYFVFIRGWCFSANMSKVLARVNQQPPMHQLAVLSTGWSSSQFISYLVFFFLFFLVLDRDLTHRYPSHLPTLISTAPTLVPYLLSPTNIANLITSYLIDLTTIQTTYPINYIPY